MDLHEPLRRRLGDGEYAEVDLISLTKDRVSQETQSLYYIKHSNKRTILEQQLSIIGNSSGYKASILITDFPLLPTEKEAALKLADWLKRLGSVIEAGFTDSEETK